MRVAIQHRPIEAQTGLVVKVTMAQAEPSIDSVARERPDQFVQNFTENLLTLHSTAPTQRYEERMDMLERVLSGLRRL